MSQPSFPSSRNQTERVIAAARVAFAASGLFAIWMDPAEPARNTELTYGLHAVYVLYSLALIPLVWGHWRGRLPIVTHVVDILLSSVFQYLTLGPSSPFFVYFIFSLFCGAMRWGWRGTLSTAAVVVVAYVGMAVSMGITFGPLELEVNRFIIRVVYLAVTAALLVYLGRYEERLRREIGRLARWPNASGADSDRTIREILAHAAQIVGAGRVAMVWEQGEEPAIYLAAWSGERTSISKHSPEKLTPLLAPELERTTFVREGDGPATEWTVSDGTTLREPEGRHGPGRMATTRTLTRSGVDLHPELQRHLTGNGLASALFKTERVSGRVFFSALGPRALEVVPLIEVVARELGASLDQLHVTRQLQDLAAGEERIRVARDLHDGVLQSLTGIRLEIRAVAGLEGIEEAVRDRLFAMERAMAIEQRELRLFIAELGPHATARDDTPLAARLHNLLDRIAVQWKAPITIRVAEGGAVIPERLEQAVPLMVHEAVVNALKHGQPSRVAVTVDGTPGKLRIVVSDDGRGFPFRGHYGHEALVQGEAGPRSLLGRVIELGGQMSIESSDAGARVEVLLAL